VNKSILADERCWWKWLLARGKHGWLTLIKRLFQSNSVNRVLFLVDRITLAKQTEDAFVEHLTDYPCYLLKAGRGMDDAKRVTIATLQTMINEYEAFSSGYYDLVITDECHRSIYGKWSDVLKHFNGFQIGLTATPCVVKDLDGHSRHCCEADSRLG